MSWFHRDKAGPPQSADPLMLAVRSAMPAADDETVQIVAALAGLLTCVAYADGEFTTPEERELRRALSQVQGLAFEGVNAIVWSIRDRHARIAGVEASTYARHLFELSASDFRQQVLDLAVELAAADDTITVSETNTLRQVATALGLSQDDYNQAQARFRDKLAVLKK